MKFADVANIRTFDQVATPRSGLAREFVRLWLLARYRFSRGARPWLGVTTALATILVAIFLHLHILRPLLWKSGDVYAALPLTGELARLPMSFFLPTSYLPLWAACLQLVVVIGLGEMILGRWLTIVVAAIGHFGATLVARVLLESAHGHLFGLLPSLAHALDTGPSAATTAVGACLLVTMALRRCALLLAAGLLVAAFITRGFDGIEHTTALMIGVTAGALDYLVISRLLKDREESWKERWSATLTGVVRVAKSLRRAVTGLLLRSEAR